MQDSNQIHPLFWKTTVLLKLNKLTDIFTTTHNTNASTSIRNEELIKPGVSFREFAEKAWQLPDNCFDNHYPCQIHGVGMSDEWPFIAYPNEDYSNGDYSGVFEENMVVCVESYIGEVEGSEGAKLEDQYLVTDKGLKLLSSIPLDLV